MLDLEIINLILKSYKEVAKIENLEVDLGEKHKQKSRTLIAKIHENLNNYFNDENISIFSLGLPNEVFNRSEYLFDIQVCRTDTFNPNVHKEKNVHFIKESLIQIESEFKQDTNASSIDFSKLVCGKSKLKIMILPRSKSRDLCKNNYLIPLTGIAKCINENLYVVFLPHPSKWGESIDTNIFEVFQYNKFLEGNWKYIDNRIFDYINGV
jgi:hypothetical protein